MLILFNIGLTDVRRLSDFCDTSRTPRESMAVRWQRRRRRRRGNI